MKDDMLAVAEALGVAGAEGREAAKAAAESAAFVKSAEADARLGLVLGLGVFTVLGACVVGALA